MEGGFPCGCSSIFPPDPCLPLAPIAAKSVSLSVYLCLADGGGEHHHQVNYVEHYGVSHAGLGTGAVERCTVLLLCVTLSIVLTFPLTMLDCRHVLSKKHSDYEY